MIPPRLEILSIGTFERDPGLLPVMADALRSRFGFQATTLACMPVLDEWRDRNREQLSSNRIVDYLIQRACDAGDSHEDLWTLAVTEEDLFAPELTFVFGEATLGGGWALVSTARLGEEPGAPSDPELVRRRVLTEAVHELGHLGGLQHCPRPECVMHPSRLVADVDVKSSHFCPDCHQTLFPG